MSKQLRKVGWRGKVPISPPGRPEGEVRAVRAPATPMGAGPKNNFGLPTPLSRAQWHLSKSIPVPQQENEDGTMIFDFSET